MHVPLTQVPSCFCAKIPGVLRSVDLFLPLTHCSKPQLKFDVQQLALASAVSVSVWMPVPVVVPVVAELVLQNCATVGGVNFALFELSDSSTILE
jgi:hypothetical protein